jgi:hypothetical protein
MLHDFSTAPSRAIGMQLHPEQSIVRGVLGCNCPLGDELFDGHEHALVARVRSGEQPRVQGLVDAMKRGQWDAMSAFLDLELAADALLVYAVRCPSGRIFMVIIDSPADTMRFPTLVAWDEAVSEADLLARIDGASWVPT